MQFVPGGPTACRASPTPVVAKRRFPAPRWVAAVALGVPCQRYIVFLLLCFRICARSTLTMLEADLSCAPILPTVRPVLSMAIFQLDTLMLSLSDLFKTSPCTRPIVAPGKQH